MISNIINNSNHITPNIDTPTSAPNITRQQQTSTPDTTFVPSTLYTTWNTKHSLSSDHFPIIITLEPYVQLSIITNKTLDKITYYYTNVRTPLSRFKKLSSSSFGDVFMAGDT